MYNIRMLRKELKDVFLQEFTVAEKLIFLRKAEESILQKGYPTGEDLFQYCYFFVMKERMSGISPVSGESYMRFLLVKGRKDIEDTIKMYAEKLEKKKLQVPDPNGYKFLEHFSE